MAGDAIMSDRRPLIDRVHEYLAHRRKLGFALKVEGGELLRFARYAQHIGHEGPITTELTLRWAREAHHSTTLYQAKRVEAVRGLAKYLAALEPGTEIAPREILGPAHRRVEPFIYSQKQISRLLLAAGRLPSKDGLRSRTCTTVLGLLACSGLRVGEALRLDRLDLDTKEGVLIVRQTKFNKSRIVPLDRSACRPLRQYAAFRDRCIPCPSCPRFFLSSRGGPVGYTTLCYNFQQIRRAAGLGDVPGRRPPRMYDLRHTFACRRILSWYREGRDVNHLLSRLCTYLGHVKISDTYWYLTATPELMAAATRRFDRFVREAEQP
jgi:integrase